MTIARPSLPGVDAQLPGCASNGCIGNGIDKLPCKDDKPRIAGGCIPDAVPTAQGVPIWSLPQLPTTLPDAGGGTVALGQ
mmetsp:Transcript_31025/g.59944  ORF Transcript_31025/g.59944 Transcript_31025/m.59944 type:complete len:80 (-) Transcript_31025:348-587(-)